MFIFYTYILQQFLSLFIKMCILSYVCFTEATFEPITLLLIFYPFVMNWPLQEQVHFHDKRNIKLSSHKSTFKKPIGPITELRWEP